MPKAKKTLGVMIDMSRDAVMSLDSLKSFLKTIRKMGYNAVFLYMEDTYEVEGETYFGYMRGRYSIEELEAEILPLPFSREPQGQPIDYSHYGKIMSANALTQSM